jgi:hypothetical protein
MRYSRERNTYAAGLTISVGSGVETEKVDTMMRAVGKDDVSHKEPKHVRTSALDQGTKSSVA